HFDWAGDDMGAHVVVCPSDVYRAADIRGFHTAAGICDVDGAGNRSGLDVALDAGDVHASRSRGDAQDAANPGNFDGAAGRAELRFAVHTIDMHVARSRRALHGAAHLIDGDAARSHAGVNFGVARDFNLVVNGDILQPGGLFANQNGAAALLHGRIADRVLNVFFGVAPEGPAFSDSSMDVDLAVPGPANLHIAGAVAELQTNGAGYGEGSVKGVIRGGSLQSQERECRGEKDDAGQGQFVGTHVRFSLSVQALLPISTQNRNLCSRGFRQSFVQGALAIAFQVEGHVGETRCFQGAGDGGGHIRRERAGKFVRGEFDACQVVMETHAELAEAQFAEGRFATLDQRKAFGGDFRAVGQPRRKAGG